MRGVFLPGNSTTDIRELPDPEPGPGQVLLAMRASTICGSDIRAIYREHVQGDPAEMYQGVVAGHEPAGEVVAVGPGRRPAEGGRPGLRLPHQRLRPVRRLRSRLPDQLLLDRSGPRTAGSATEATPT